MGRRDYKSLPGLAAASCLDPQAPTRGAGVRRCFQHDIDHLCALPLSAMSATVETYSAQGNPVSIARHIHVPGRSTHRCYWQEWRKT